MKNNILVLLITIMSSAAIAQNDLEPQFIDFYFTDKAGEKITGSVTVADKLVFLYIITENAKGEDVVLTMDEDEEYFYKKQFLAGGSSVKFPVKKDIEKVKLVIYNPGNKKHVKRRMEAEGYTTAEDAQE